jgi:pimeloyl-ACP methyl ester carboxylesterase
MLNLNHSVPRTGTSLPKALQAELDRLGASYTCGQCDDPNAEARTFFHLFHPAGDPPTIASVLFHGTGNDALFCWENIILDLLRSGRAVFAFDLPGHGQGSSTIFSEASFARCAAFLPKLLPELLPSLKETEAIGYSLGALAALQQLARSTMPWRSLVLMALPERVNLTAAFLLIEALSFFKSCWWQQLRTYGWDASFPAFGLLRRSRFPIRLDPDIRMSYPEFVGHLLKLTDVPAELSRLRVPTLLVYGTRDYLATTAYGQSLGKTCEGIEGANHFLLPLRTETRSKILAWLTSRPHPAER